MDDLKFNAIINYVPYGIGLIVTLVALFFMRVWIRSSVNKKVRSIRDTPAMSMMDIETMRKRGLVSETEYKSIRHALAEREVEKERRRQQSERERAILAQIENDPDAARQLLNVAPEPAVKSAPAAAPAGGRMAGLTPQASHPHNPTQAQPRPAARPQPARAAMDEMEAEQARVFQLSSADLVLPALLQPPPPAPATQPRPAPQKPQARTTQPTAPRPTPAPQPPSARPAQAQPAAPRPTSAAPPRPVAQSKPVPAAAGANTGQGKPASDLDLLLQKGAITPEEYQRLKAFVQ